MGLFRLILALWVVINHGESFFGQKVPQSWAAVQCFFIISGFYMTLILNEKYTGPGSVKLFLTNRFLRLFPSYWAVLVFSLAVIGAFWFFGHRDIGTLQIWRANSSLLGWQNVPLLVAANAFIFGQNEIMYLKMDALNGALSWTSNFDLYEPKVWRFLFLPQSWSIELELMFYVIAPFIVRKSLRTIFFFIGASIAVRLVIYGIFKLTNDPWTYRFFPNELALFLLGAVSYHIYRAPWRDKIATPKVVAFLASLLFLITLTFPLIKLPGQIKAWPYFVLATVTIPLLFAHTKSWKFDRYIGELSYPIYLVHFLVVGVCTSILPPVLQYHRSIITAVISIVLAMILLHLIINPMERIRQNRAHSA